MLAERAADNGRPSRPKNYVRSIPRPVPAREAEQCLGYHSCKCDLYRITALKRPLPLYMTHNSFIVRGRPISIASRIITMQHFIPFINKPCEGHRFNPPEVIERDELWTLEERCDKCGSKRVYNRTVTRRLKKMYPTQQNQLFV